MTVVNNENLFIRQPTDSPTVAPVPTDPAAELPSELPVTPDAASPAPVEAAPQTDPVWDATHPLRLAPDAPDAPVADVPSTDTAPEPETPAAPPTCAHCGATLDTASAEARCPQCGCDWAADGTLHTLAEGCRKGAWWGAFQVAP
ncbi:MAG TPA: hypothetical protein VIO16_14490 [Dehalococcoidia bacterium]